MATDVTTAEIPRAGELASLAVHSTIHAMRTMPALFGSAALFSVLIALGDIGSDYAADHLAAHWGGSVLPPLWGIASLLLNVLLLAPVAVAVHRQILLEETTPGIISWRAPRILHFALWSLLIEIVTMIVPMPVEATVRTGLEFAAFAIFGALALIICVRGLMIFPAVAVDTPAASRKERVLASWDQTRGHFWRLALALLGAMILIFVPVVLAALAMFVLAVVSDSYQFVYAVRFAVDLLAGALEPLAVAVAAAVASWFYGSIAEIEISLRAQLKQ